MVMSFSNNRQEIDKAWVTLVTNDTYALGALVLAHSLKKVNTAHKLVVLVSSNVTFAMRGTLQSIYDEVKEVNILDSADTENLRLLARPELGITFTKLHCWKLTQYEKCVFLDADTLVLQNCDELFDREELSAAPDVGWPDCFNSGVFVFKPSEETFKSLYEFAITHGSFDGGDQGLLNMYFSDWATSDASKRLPFLYNLSSAAIYSYLPAFKWYGRGVKIVHFIGTAKPWVQPFNSLTRSVEAAPGSSHLQNFLQYWWDLFCACVHPQLSPEMAGLANSLSQMKLDEATPEQKAREDFLRRQNWEHGNIDYMGKDSFNNIWDKISQTMNFQPEADPSAIDKASSAESISSPSSTESSAPVQSSVPETCPKAPSSAQPSQQAPASAQSVEEPQSCPKPPASAQPAVQPASCPKPPASAQTTEQPASCPKPPAASQPAEQPASCPKPPAPSQPTEQPASCPKPPAPSQPTEQLASCPKPPAPSRPTEQPASCPKPPAPSQPPQQPATAEPTEAPLCCPKPSKPAPTEPTVSAPVAEVPVAPTPSKPAVESTPAPVAAATQPTPQVPTPVEKSASSAPEASPVCQKPAPIQAQGSQEAKPAPAQDPKSKPAAPAPAKSSGSKKK
ncbi:glycogenin-1 isoform X3 [Planococcus citri]|uniref:glycogenin-1 isoform X3 n=1 Tax=Planococcus citri TaxID=170843 RepID=UPI0031F9097C